MIQIIMKVFFIVVFLCLTGAAIILGINRLISQWKNGKTSRR